MKLMLAEPKFLIDSVGIISELVNEVNFKFDNDGVELIAMDPANVSMVIFKLLSSGFTEYKVEDNYVLGVSLDSFKQVLRRVKPGDVLILELDKDKNRLKIQIKGENTRTFNLALIDVDAGKQKVPELQFPLRVETSTEHFQEAIDDMDVIAESVGFVADKNEFVIESEGKLNDARYEIKSGQDTVIDYDGETLKSKYSIEYLKKMVKGCKLSDKVVLQFGKNYPLKLDYHVKDKLSLSFVLAPRVAND